MRYMAEKVSAIDVRQRIGDLLNRVALRNDEFIIERKGKPLAALVAVERLDQMRELARRHALEPLEKPSSSSLDDEGAKILAQEAKQWARSTPKRRPSKAE